MVLPQCDLFLCVQPEPRRFSKLFTQQLTSARILGGDLTNSIYSLTEIVYVLKEREGRKSGFSLFVFQARRNKIKDVQ